MNPRTRKLRLTLRRFRRGFLFVSLVTVSGWGVLTYRADHETFAWNRPLHVEAVVLLDGSPANPPRRAERFVAEFTSRTATPGQNVRGVEQWVNREFRRHSGRQETAVRLSTRGPLWVHRPPPEPPARDSSFLGRVRATQRFLEYFTERAAEIELALGAHDVTIFVYFYDPARDERRHRFAHTDSVASRRDRLAAVFVPLNESELGNTCAVIAHELFHILGATDKYDNASSVFPEGFAEPQSTPLYPQEKAEIMAMSRPVGPGRERSVSDLSECVVGAVTAEEMGWLRPPLTVPRSPPRSPASP